MFKYNTYWNDQLKINHLQRVILIHSFLYYENDTTVVTDKQFDEWMKQLLQLQNKHTKSWIKQNTMYGYCFYDFDGVTGFDLWNRLKTSDKKRICSIALLIVKGKNKNV